MSWYSMYKVSVLLDDVADGSDVVLTIALAEFTVYI